MKSIQPVSVEVRGKVKWRVIIPKRLRGEIGQRTKWFTSKGKAEAYAASLDGQRCDIAQKFHELPRMDQARVMEALARAGSPDALMDAVIYYQAVRPSKPMPLRDLIEQCVDSKRRSGKSDHYVRCLAMSLKSFLRGRESLSAHQVTASEIESWIANGRTRHGRPWSWHTKKDYLRDLKTLFQYAVRHGYCAANPALKVERPVEPDTRPGILTVEECTRLMRTAEKHDRPMLLYLALCLFAGLRPSEALRIEPDNLKAEHIEVFGKRARTRQRRLVPVNPTLKAWLRLGGEHRPVNRRKRMDRLRKLAAIPWPADCLRHSHVSYAVPEWGARETSLRTGHSENILFKHYRELVSAEQAKKFWGILPTL